MGSQSNSQDPQPQSLWKSMFSKLMGPDSSVPIKPINDPDDLDGLDLDLLPSEKPKTSASTPSKQSKSSKPSTQSSFADVTFDSDPEIEVPASLSRKSEEVFFDDDEDEDDFAPEPEAPAATEASSEAEPPGDDYWDALADLNPGADHDEPSESPRGGGGGRGGRGGRSSGSRSGGRHESSRSQRSDRTERADKAERSDKSDRRDSRPSRRDEPRRDEPRRTTEPSAPKAEEAPERSPKRPTKVDLDLFDDDEFGVGLIEETRAQFEAAETEFETEGEEETRRPRRRRGRRGRRGRDRSEGVQERTIEGVEAEHGFVDASDVDFDNDEAPAVAAPRSARGPRPAPRVEVSVDFDDDVDAAPIKEEPQASQAGRAPARRNDEDEESAPRRSRRGRRGGSRRDRSPEAETSTPVETRSAPATNAADEEDDHELETAEERRDRYRNIPTWEEAISYLVRPKRRAGQSGRSNSGGRSGGDRSGGGRSQGSRGH